MAAACRRNSLRVTVRFSCFLAIIVSPRGYPAGRSLYSTASATASRNFW
jgi:hypothetical protein